MSSAHQKRSLLPQPSLLRYVFILLPIIVLLFVLIYTLRENSSTADQNTRPSSMDETTMAQNPVAGSRDGVKSPSAAAGSELFRPDQSGGAPSDSRDSHSRPAGLPLSPFAISNSRPLTPQGDFIRPRFSPDGQDVLFTKAQYHGIYLVSINGGDVRELSGELSGYDVRWSADGTKLIVRIDGEDRVIDLSGADAGSADGLSLVAEPVVSRNDNIYLVDPDSGDETPLTNGGDSWFSPQISPDGNKVAYEGLTTGIQIKDLKTGEITDIGQGNGAQWTPDGSGLIYQYAQDDGHDVISGDIYYARADGSGLFNITNTPDIIELHPMISPCGRYVTYEVDGQVFIADLFEVQQ